MTEDYKEKFEAGIQYQDWVVEKLYDAGLPIISYSSKKYQNLIGENKREIIISTSKGFLLPVKDAEELYAIKIIS